MDHGIVEAGSSTRARSEWDCLPSDYIPIDHGIGAGRCYRHDRVTRDNSQNGHSRIDPWFHTFSLFLILPAGAFTGWERNAERLGHPNCHLAQRLRIYSPAIRSIINTANRALNLSEKRNYSPHLDREAGRRLSSFS
jgi:hypothetical protein